MFLFSNKNKNNLNRNKKRISLYFIYKKYIKKKHKKTNNASLFVGNPEKKRENNKLYKKKKQIYGLFRRFNILTGETTTSKSCRPQFNFQLYNNLLEPLK